MKPPTLINLSVKPPVGDDLTAKNDIVGYIRHNNPDPRHHEFPYRYPFECFKRDEIEITKYYKIFIQAALWNIGVNPKLMAVSVIEELNEIAYQFVFCELLAVDKRKLNKDGDPYQGSLFFSEEQLKDDDYRQKSIKRGIINFLPKRLSGVLAKGAKIRSLIAESQNSLDAPSKQSDPDSGSPMTTMDSISKKYQYYSDEYYERDDIQSNEDNQFSEDHHEVIVGHLENLTTADIGILIKLRKSSDYEKHSEMLEKYLEQIQTFWDLEMQGKTRTEKMQLMKISSDIELKLKCMAHILFLCEFCDPKSPSLYGSKILADRIKQFITLSKWKAGVAEKNSFTIKSITERFTSNKRKQRQTPEQRLAELKLTKKLAHA